MDNSEMLDRFKNEVSLGKKAEQAYNGFIKPFIEDRKVTLFESFCEASIGEPEVLMEAKRLVTVICDLDDEIQGVINTGKLAAKSLAEYNPSDT